MSNQFEPFDSLDSVRAEMRLRLSQQFRALHRRRRQQRIAAICLVPAALLALLAVWNWSRSPQRSAPTPAVDQLATNPPPVQQPKVETAPPNALEVAEKSNNPVSPQPAAFKGIEYIELKPDDLPEWLAEAKSDLIVYKVNGRTEVVSERELLAGADKKRKPQVN